MRRRRADHRAATDLPTAVAHAQAAAAAASRAVGGRRALRLQACQSRRAPHDPVRRGVAADVRRHHPRRPADGRPVTARDSPHRRRPVARTGRPRAVVRAGAGAEPDPGRSRLGRGRRHLRRGDARHRAGTVARDRRRHRAVARSHARRLGPPGNGRRHAVRLGAHLRPNRAVPAGQHRARHRQRRARRLVDRAGRRGADRDALRAPRRRPDHRTGARASRTPDHRLRRPNRPRRPNRMIHSELDAAGVSQPRLRDAYRRCRQLNARHGRTFFLATRLLAPAQRPAVHALYGFARLADDILDDLDPPLDEAAKTTMLQRFSDRFFENGAKDDDEMDDDEMGLVLAAVRHTATIYGIDAQLFSDFLTSMRMDLTITDYPDRASLNTYMHGSAEAIGLELLPVLGTVVPRNEAAPYAAALGKAFQLTNFRRDVDEDLTRERVYLPADELAAFDVDRDLLTWCHVNRRTDPRVRSALAAQHHVTRGIYRFAGDGVQMLAPWSRPCVATALTLYSEILDRIEASDFAVFNQRASVGTARRMQVAGGAL